MRSPSYYRVLINIVCRKTTPAYHHRKIRSLNNLSPTIVKTFQNVLYYNCPIDISMTSLARKYVIVDINDSSLCKTGRFKLSR